jgi:hypothetical protein
MNQQEKEHIIKKQERREKKRAEKRNILGEEVIFIFEKVLEGWKTIKIYNTLIQANPACLVNKKTVESISTGNCKVYPKELSAERFQYYLSLREKVYEFHKE